MVAKVHEWKRIKELGKTVCSLDVHYLASFVKIVTSYYQEVIIFREESV